jgi:type VII secretion-associated serine protease mycosin
VIVGVVDSVVYPHPDLRRNLLQGSNVLPGQSGNGQVDEDGHGTGMAGLIAAHGRTGNRGILGIAPAAKILPVKDSDATRNGSSISVAAGIQWAASNGARVVNVSSANAPSIAMKEAVATAAANDVVVVASPGNRPDALQFGYPAAIPGVLAVGSTDRANKHAPFSVTGEQMQICAPGVDIESPRLKAGYSFADGTSSSTAIVSGAAALVRAKFPDLSAQEVIHRLTATATDIGKPGRDDECGYGLLNIVKALTADVPPLEATTPTSSSTPTDNAAAPAPGNGTDPEADESTNTAAIAGGIGAGVLLLGGLAAILLVKRRRKTS